MNVRFSSAEARERVLSSSTDSVLRTEKTSHIQCRVPATIFNAAGTSALGARRCVGSEEARGVSGRIGAFGDRRNWNIQIYAFTGLLYNPVT